MNRKLYAYVDGGARGNPGPSAWGAYVPSLNHSLCGWVGDHCTNNVAEYHGLIGLLEWARCQGYDEVTVCTDSLLMMNQVRGTWKVKHAELRELWDRVQQLVSELKAFTIKKVPRAQNKEADAILNELLDAREK